ncbi:MAG: 5'-nucleotidase C-terminal domain-containing protein [Phaeodactylibacter sp.]|nr:5'-nucleotidase C-terminal domain-containing protein [Phaeodactylibacter sp.]
MKYRSWPWLWALALLLSACDTTRTALTVDPTVNIEFTILHFNDVYEIAPLEGGKAGGLARVATVKKELMSENPNTIAVLAGDFLSPSVIGTLKKEDGERIAGQQMVEVLNAMGLDYATFGNHEFDLKDADLLEKRINQSAFEYTVCNVQRADGGNQRPFIQEVNGREQPIPRYIIHEFTGKNGQRARLGIIGVVLPFNKADYVAYEPVTQAFREAYEELRPKVDLVVGLTHLNIDEDIELAQEVPGPLLFMGGHDHVNMNHYSEETIITKADANVKSVYIHRITYNPASGFARVRSTLKKIDDSIQDDPATKTVVDKWQGSVNSIMEGLGYDPDEQVMFAEVPLECKESAIRSRPTNYGQLTVDAYAAAWPGADVYLVNGGSMRMDDDIQGVVTQYDVLRTFPFGGPIVRMELPGNVLEKLLETGLITNRGDGGYFQAKNVERRGSQWIVGSNPVNVGNTYEVVLPEFVAQGNEQNLEFLGDFKYKTRKTLEISGQPVPNDVRNLVIAYMKTLK